jgi:hypothetical protein
MSWDAEGTSNASSSFSPYGENSLSRPYLFSKVNTGIGQAHGQGHTVLKQSNCPISALLPPTVSEVLQSQPPCSQRTLLGVSNDLLYNKRVPF